MISSLYNQSIPIFIHYLNQLDALYKKGSAFAEAQGKKPEVFLDLPFQAQAVCNSIVLFIDRVSGREHVAVEDDETTFAQLHARIARTLDYARAVTPAELDGRADQPVLMATHIGTFRFETAQAYLSQFVLANMHFHLSIAYCLLRQQGAPLGSMDYFGDVFKKVE
ncbi:hypothetical protein F5Y15DRAFT_412587 [Xylariaceae sp. FL0016]|nr:hypothetical protein F5Y15DRAFT_412587 [Xylariaceae sp. FL0016]